MTKVLNKERVIGADAALITVYKMLEKMKSEYSADIARVAINNAVLEVLNMRSEIAGLAVNNKRIKHGRD